MNEFRIKFAKEYLAEIKRTLDSIEGDLIDKIDKLSSVLKRDRANKNTIFVTGSGGAATTSHFASNLSKTTIVQGCPRFKVEEDIHLLIAHLFTSLTREEQKQKLGGT